MSYFWFLTVIIKRYSSNCNRDLIFKFYRYYAAPEEESYVHVYNDTEHCYNQSMNSSAGQYEEIPDNYEDINRREIHAPHYDVSHHYNEIETWYDFLWETLKFFIKRLICFDLFSGNTQGCFCHMLIETMITLTESLLFKRHKLVLCYWIIAFKNIFFLFIILF